MRDDFAGVGYRCSLRNSCSQGLDTLLYGVMAFLLLPAPRSEGLIDLEKSVLD